MEEKLAEDLLREFKYFLARRSVESEKGCFDEKLGNSVFSKKDLGLEVLTIVDNAGRDGSDGDAIQKSLDKMNVDIPYYFNFLQEAAKRHEVGIVSIDRLKRMEDYWNKTIQLFNPRGMIFAAPGDYSISVPILMNKDNVCLTGSGKGTKIILDASPIPYDSDGLIVTGSYCEVSNVMLDGSSGANHAGDGVHTRLLQVSANTVTRLNKLYLYNAYSRAIELDNATIVFGTDINVKNAHRGLMTWNSSLPSDFQGILIKGFTTEDIAENSIDFGGANGVVISDIDLRNTTCGIVPDASFNLKVQNGFIDSSNSAVEIVNGSGDSSDIFIKNLRGQKWFSVKSGNSHTMDNIFFESCESSGSTWRNFIAIMDGGGRLKNIHFIRCHGVNSTLFSNFAAIRENPSDGILEYIYFKDCVANMALWCGFEVEGTKNIHLKGCTASYEDHEGISLTNCEVGSVIDCVTKNNGQESAYAGIYGRNSFYILVTGCHSFDDQVTKTQHYGLRTHGVDEDTSDYWYVFGNDFRSNKLGAMVLGGEHDYYFANQGFDYAVFLEPDIRFPNITEVGS